MAEVFVKGPIAIHNSPFLL